MIEKENRIKDYREFQDIFHFKQYRSNEMFVVYYRERKLNHSRVGVAVSKKLGNAVRRNLIKRQVRAMIRSITDFQDSFDAIVVVSKRYDEKQFAKCQNRLNELWLEIRRKANEESKKVD